MPFARTPPCGVGCRRIGRGQSRGSSSACRTSGACRARCCAGQSCACPFASRASGRYTSPCTRLCRTTRPSPCCRRRARAHGTWPSPPRTRRRRQSCGGFVPMARWVLATSRRHWASSASFHSELSRYGEEVDELVLRYLCRRAIALYETVTDGEVDAPVVGVFKIVYVVFHVR